MASVRTEPSRRQARARRKGDSVERSKKRLERGEEAFGRNVSLPDAPPGAPEVS
jgi:hypothetical protein